MTGFPLVRLICSASGKYLSNFFFDFSVTQVSYGIAISIITFCPHGNFKVRSGLQCSTLVGVSIFESHWTSPFPCNAIELFGASLYHFVSNFSPCVASIFRRISFATASWRCLWRVKFSVLQWLKTCSTDSSASPHILHFASAGDLFFLFLLWTAARIWLSGIV